MKGSGIRQLLFYLQEKKKKKLGYQLLALAGKSKVDKDIYKFLEKSRIDDHDRHPQSFKKKGVGIINLLKGAL